MHARTSTMQADPSALDAGIMYLSDTVMPALEALDGYIGTSMLVDRQSGRCIVTTAWQSEEAMHASRGAVRPLRDRAAEILGGTATVEEWEIAVLHRDHISRDGACVRATWGKVSPEQADRAIDGYKLATLPALDEIDGFCSASLLVDRSTGRGVASVTFDSTDAMQRSKEQMETIKTASMRDSGAEVLDECDFELALAHLRVPEMA